MLSHEVVPVAANLQWIPNVVEYLKLRAAVIGAYAQPALGIFFQRNTTCMKTFKIHFTW